MTKINIDTATLKKIANLLNKENLAEIEIGQGDEYVRITRNFPNLGGAVQVPAQQIQAPEAKQETKEKSDTAEKAEKTYENAVKSPIVGTAYLAPSPAADPFVTVGQSVKKGDTVIIVEAMKVMNQIPANKDGVISKILVSDGQPVEFEQSLIVID